MRGTVDLTLFFRSAGPYRGELVPPTTVEEFVPFTPEEPHWSLAGAEKPVELLAIEAQLAEKREGARKRRKAKVA